MSNPTPSSSPWLARKLLWLSHPRTPANLALWLGVTGAGLVLLEVGVYFFSPFFSTAHEAGHGHASDFPGWQALYGLGVGAALVWAARILRRLTGRNEDYYQREAQEAKADETHKDGEAML